ncbi:MAG: TetR/AcrR family transcriptional regulator [Lysobacterales bacterium]|jgi:AcrR family transcriptional regulator
MQDGTREQLLSAAKKQFAEKGFYGASIAQVAGEVGLTKQALLYHFKRKEDLYAEVLQDISQRLLRFVRSTVSRSETPERQLEDVLLGLYYASRESPMDTRILVRELLDNQARAEKAKDWYLLPFLSEIVAVLRRIPGFERIPESSAFCMIYQLIGSSEYFTISTATLTRMYGEEAYEGFRNDFPMELRSQIRRLIDSHRREDA